MQTKIIRIDPRRLRLLKLNARFMRHETFNRLTENIKDDGDLTSVPFCAILDYFKAGDTILRDADTGEPVYEVLSGNHRVKAAIAAALNEITVMVTDEPLSPDRRRAIQLAHNAIAGEDDPALLKTIYTSIQNVGLRFYSGLDDKTLKLLEDVQPGKLEEASLVFQSVAMVFLPHEVEAVKEIWDKIKPEVKKSKANWLASMESYDLFMDSLEKVQLSYGVKNVATALMIMLEVFTRHLGDLREGWLQEDGEPVKRRSAPIATIFETELVPSQLGAKLEKVVQRMLANKEITKAERWKALEKMADVYLASSKLTP